MKKIFKHTILAVGAVTASLGMTSCLEEAFPQDGTFTEEQVKDASMEALSLSMPAYFTATGAGGWDIGFAGFHIWRDAATADMPTAEESWDYFRYFNTQRSIGNSSGISKLFWDRYYSMIKRANNVLKICTEDVDNKESYYRGAAYVFRAMSYLDLIRQFEYKHTGVEKLDAYANENKLWGITVPMITENTTEAEARNTPRQPYWVMYRFILDDLAKAEKYLTKWPTSASKDMPDLGVCYGFQARLWMEMASRFELYPTDLATQLEKENATELAHLAKLGISDANDCYRKAAECARKAINRGYTPVTKDEWINAKSGFNTPVSAWMFAVIITPENGLAKNATWNSWPSYMTPETSYGLGGPDYGCYRMIDALLFSAINPDDWRRDTWMDPEFKDMADSDEKEKMFQERYQSITNYSYAKYCTHKAYAGFKFHPANGEMNTASIGNAVSIPMMRVEEMYFIEMEAMAHYQSPAAAIEALNNFMTTYRMKNGKTFKSTVSQLDDVIDEIWTQKRVELWGEGQVWWDYKRRELPIIRGYEGTNHPALYRYNSIPGFVAPWTNIYIMQSVRDLNSQVVLNPDASGAIPTLWTE